MCSYYFATRRPSVVRLTCIIVYVFQEKLNEYFFKTTLNLNKHILFL